MKKIIIMIALMATMSACTMRLEPGTSHNRTSFSPEVGYIYEGCDPRDYDYSHTEVDCPDSYWTIDVCDPDGVYYRRDCWTEGEVRWSFGYDCYIEHFCW